MDSLNIPQSRVYIPNVGSLKKYGNLYKLSHLRYYRRKGFEEVDPPKKNSAGNTKKLSESLSRTKTTIHELAQCNQWQFFITLTLNPQKYDRNNLRNYIKALGKWLNNYNYQNDFNIKYLLIPEPHKDGAWHMHGLLNGLPLNKLERFKLTDNIPLRLKNLIKENRVIYNWPDYAKNFGWVTAEEIISKDACAGYILKYVTKDVHSANVGLNNHLYYCSHGLARATQIHIGKISTPFKPDYINDYVSIKWFENEDEAMQHFEKEV